MILATAFDGKYVPGFAYVESLRQHCNIRWQILAVDWTPPDGFANNWTTVPDSGMPRRMLQHGGFLPYVETEPDEVIVFTDADIVMQRPLLDDELNSLSSLNNSEFAIGRNNGLADTLFDEHNRLAPIASLSESERWFPGFPLMSCWNFGFVAARRSTWNLMHERFMELWPAANSAYRYYAKVQFLCCYVINRDFSRVDVPLTLHAHGHFGHPEGVKIENGVALFGDTPIAFRHKL